MPDYFALKAFKRCFLPSPALPGSGSKGQGTGIFSAYSQPSFAPLSSPLKPLYLIFHFLV